MALAKFVQKSSSVLLRPRVQSLVPTAAFQTSQILSKKKYWFYKPEYDENGGKIMKFVN